MTLNQGSNMKFKPGDYLISEFYDEKEILRIDSVEPNDAFTYVYRYTVIDSNKSWRIKTQSTFVHNSARANSRVMSPKDKLELL